MDPDPLTCAAIIIKSNKALHFWDSTDSYPEPKILSKLLSTPGP
jgi:hypothetical protein